MTSLTVGQVSALIAAGTTALQILLPLAIPLILIAFIKKRHDQVQETAVTWSALSRTLHSTYWPTILNSDSSSSKGVNFAVISAVYLGIFTTILVAITAVITPLGLYDSVAPSKPQSVSFNYAQDMTYFGQGSLPRNGMGFNRICGRGMIACPGSNFSVIPTADLDEKEWPDGYYTNISLETQNVWASGLHTMQSSVSSIFDIQWRSYKISQQNSSKGTNRYKYDSPDKVYDNGSPYVVGGYRQIQSLLSSDGFKIIEGLLVDLARGGIGFRNHTVPSRSSQSAVWTEDILFIVPETECVDNNIAFDYDLKQENGTNKLGPGGVVYLTDRGGFANLNEAVNHAGLPLTNSQENVHLRDRALFAAWKSNAYTMLYMNLTDDDHLKQWRGYENAPIGTTYRFEDESSTDFKSGKLGDILPEPGRITLRKLGQHLDLRSSPESDSKLENTNQIFSNPHNVTERLFSDLEFAVQGFVNETSLANISNILMSVGTLYPPPRPVRQEWSPFDRGQAGDAWSQQMYTCVSASRATIKTVTFLYNGTGALAGLHVLNATEKIYTHPSDMPVWGVEDSGLHHMDIPPLWGLVSSDFEGKPNISTISKSSLWLPGFKNWDTTAPVDGTMNIPGASFHSTIMDYIYKELLSSASATQSEEVQDYSGRAQFALYQRWLELGRTATRSADIINLIWTDIAANAIIGTRGLMSKASGPNMSENRNPNNSREVPKVVFYEKRVGYHIAYAGPAMLLLLLTLLLSLAVATLLVLRRTGLDRMNWFLDRTSLGRNFTALLYPDVTSQKSTRKAWAENDAQKLVIVALDRPYASNPESVGIDHESMWMDPESI